MENLFLRQVSRSSPFPPRPEVRESSLPARGDLGLIRVRTAAVFQVYQDPLVILRFAESPSILIPVTWWLPVSSLSLWDPSISGIRPGHANSV